MLGAAASVAAHGRIDPAYKDSLRGPPVNWFSQDSSKGGERSFRKADGTALVYSNQIAPGQSVWVSPEDVLVNPDNKKATVMGEVCVAVDRAACGPHRSAGQREHGQWWPW